MAVLPGLPLLRYYKLLHHQRSQPKQFATEDVALCPKDFPFVAVGDVISIYNPDETQVPRLLLKLTKGSLREDFIQKVLSNQWAATFQLKPYTDVIVERVDQAEVELDSLELTFRDQYLGRSEMWRLKMGLVDTGVYLGKKLSSALQRYDVRFMRCGVLVTRLGLALSVLRQRCGCFSKLFYERSTSVIGYCMVYVFLQMSSEMWEFDIYGDLYFEKAVNGFLAQLFAKWKKNGSNHEVTIVLFSRVYYDAVSLDSFPEPMRECMQVDYRGKFYEDFYRVAVQNEKYEDWGSTLIYLRRIFVQYQSSLLDFHKRIYPSVRLPKCCISSAAQGNFLEVLNMSLNVFEKHFLDRSFDRTGQLSVVITPGVGVFEVDRELANVTMQRIIDNGVGSDLVCIGGAAFACSAAFKVLVFLVLPNFYSTHRKVGYASYIPRIRLPTKALTSLHSGRVSMQEYAGSPVLGHCHFLMTASKQMSNDDTSWPNSIYDFDDYDDKIYKLPGSHSALKKRMTSKKSPLSEAEFSKIFLRQNSEPEMNQSTFSDPTACGSGTNQSNVGSDRLPLKSTHIHICVIISVARNRIKVSHKEKWFMDDLAMNRNSQTQLRSPSGSSYGGSPKDKTTPIHTKPKELKKQGRALINPFDPSNAVIKLTSNRRRWTHIFPRGPTGNLIQQHHFPSGSTKLEIVHEGETTPGGPGSGPSVKSRSGKSSVARQSSSDITLGQRSTLLWGATGEQEWTPALTTGVDWKSLTIPACLPLTTDYFPDERSLQVDYLVNDYGLLPDDVNADYSQQRAVYRRPLNTKEVFVELVSQRLAQGFQLVIRSQTERCIPKMQSSTLMRSVSHLNTSDVETSEEYLLSIGRIFHRIKLLGSTITVTRYRPRNENYETATAWFTTEKLENYNWNYLDHYICTRGDPDFALTENLKYWRFRMLILPTQQVSKRSYDEQMPCIGTSGLKVEETSAIVQDYLKFIETCINRIRRPNNSFPKGARGSSGGSQGSASSAGGFRERVNSNKITDRPRMRSGSKLIDSKTSNRPETGSGRVSPLEGTLEFKNAMTLSDPFIDLQNPLPLIDQSTYEAVPQELKLKSTATRREIVAAMRSLKTGFSLIKSTDLPPWTFVSYDAVIWLMNHMDGLVSEVQAVNIFNEMLNEGLILHASGDTKHPFVFGFYLYYIVIMEPEGLQPLHPHGDCALFHNEWMEVEVPYEYCFGKRQIPDTGSQNESALTESRESIDRPKIKYKTVYVDVDVAKKSDRQEWGHVKYQSVYKPDEAFKLTLQWMQSTGAIVADLVQGWSRKAQQCNLQLVPIPNDLFDNSDSLRAPIFIPLNIAALSKTSEMQEELCALGILSFQMYLLLQSGFLRCHLDRTYMDMKHQNQKTDRLLFVHSSGNIFVLIPQNETYTQPIGYLWSCNYMVSKRWRTSSTPALGDEAYMQNVLRDFRECCSNQENRLLTAWNTFNSS
ncbi:DEP domain-containing protein 5 [Orchesella cincta]|uniref:DEP domain-containing protein 5 n=1 Tax=Orchesella cincta TaxID=48709 RepID=A0A1D2MNJ7_ORCCI|nr:DEP domain-containing protein 5 [Orchesella cincta]